MIFSISPRCSGENAWARALVERTAAAAASTISATASGRRMEFHRWCPFRDYLRRAGLRRLVARDVVGLAPSPGEPTGKRGLGARGKRARGLQVAARERGLRGGEIGAGEVALAAVGHAPAGRTLPAIPARAASAASSSATASSAIGLVVGREQRLAEHDLDQRRIGRKLHRAAQRRDRLGGRPASSSAWPLSSWK